MEKVPLKPLKNFYADEGTGYIVSFFYISLISAVKLSSAVRKRL